MGSATRGAVLVWSLAITGAVGFTVGFRVHGSLAAILVVFVPLAVARYRRG